jgi:Ca2+-binding EF-hand superfamily protein
MTTAIANDRLRRRFEKWDVDGDGVLDRSDFEEEAGRVAQAFGKGVNSPEGRALRNAFLDLFDYHATEAGIGPHGQLSEEQFVDINERLMFERGESRFDRVLRPVLEALVGLCDDNGDGQINQWEFTNWLKGVGVGPAEARTAFQRIDANGDGELSVEELLAAVRNFHYGTLDVPLLG